MVRKKTTISTQLENRRDYTTNSNEWDNLDNGKFCKEIQIIETDSIRN